MLGWIIFLGFILAATYVVVWRFVVGKRRPGYLSVTEYWVYTAEPKLPPQEAIMTRVVSENPHMKRGLAPIGAREGMLFSDLRLHLAVATRAKNPHAFRPDLSFTELEPSAEILERLSQSQALIKVRYVSEAPLADTRHLQFLPHLTDAVSGLSDALVIYDTVSQELFKSEDFHDKLNRNPIVERPDYHVRVLWKTEEQGRFAETRGLQKVGHHEWRTELMEADEEVLIVGLVMRAAFAQFRDTQASGPWEFEEFGDTFVIEKTDRIEDGFRIIQIKRRRVA